MFKITLRAARISCGYTIDEVAMSCGINIDSYRRYESDPGLMPASIAYRVRKLLQIPLDLIYV